LVALLAPGGRLIIPVGPRYATQALTVVDRGLDGCVGRPREVMSVGYVPLTRPSEMEDGWQ
jgi:protein-L-isoaspartate(D-aspartate) O-methyltransferase